MAKGGSVVFDLLFNSKLANKSLGEIAAKVSALEQKVEGASKRTEKSVNRSCSGIQELTGRILSSFVALGALDVGQKIFTTGVEFEKFTATLTNTLGSANAARSAMAMLADTAKLTPASLQELTAGYIKLNAYGLKPTKKEMIGMSDFASTMGKSFDDYVEMAADLTTFEGERGKEFGIRMQQNGEKLSMTFRGQTKEIPKTTAAVREYLKSLTLLPGIAGASAAQMQTLGGKLSSIGDQLDQMYVSIMDSNSGLINLAADGVASAIGWLDKMVNPLNSVERGLQKEQVELIKLRAQIMDVNTPEQVRLELMQKLKKEYGVHIGNIEQEAKSLQKVGDAIQQAINLNIKKMALASEQKNVEEIMSSGADAYGKKMRLQDKILGFAPGATVAWDFAKRRYTNDDGAVNTDLMIEGLLNDKKYQQRFLELVKGGGNEISFKEESQFGSNIAEYTKLMYAAGAYEAQAIKEQKRIDEWSEKWGINLDGDTGKGGNVPTKAIKPSNDLTGAISGQKNTTVNLTIHKLIGQLITQANTLGGTEKEMRENVMRILLDAVNDAIAYEAV